MIDNGISTSYTFGTVHGVLEPHLDINGPAIWRWQHLHHLSAEDVEEPVQRLRLPAIEISACVGSHPPTACYERPDANANGAGSVATTQPWRGVENAFASIGGLEPHEQICGQRTHLDKEYAPPDASLSAKRRHQVTKSSGETGGPDPSGGDMIEKSQFPMWVAKGPPTFSMVSYYFIMHLYEAHQQINIQIYPCKCGYTTH